MNTLISISDIVRNVGSVSGIHSVKIEGTATEASVTARLKNSVLVSGKMLEPIYGLDMTCGIPDLMLFKKLTNAPGFDFKTVKTTVKTETANTALHLLFELPSGHEYRFALFNKRLADEQIVVPAPKERLDFQVSTPLKQAAINLMQHWYKSLSTADPKDFWLDVDEAGKLNFTFVLGPASSNSRKVVMAEGLTGKMVNRFSYPAKIVLDVLKLSKTSKALTVYASDQGLIRIDIESECGSYQFFIAGSKN